MGWEVASHLPGKRQIEGSDGGGVGHPHLIWTLFLIVKSAVDGG